MYINEKFRVVSWKFHVYSRNIRILLQKFRDIAPPPPDKKWAHGLSHYSVDLDIYMSSVLLLYSFTIAYLWISSVYCSTPFLAYIWISIVFR